MQHRVIDVARRVHRWRRAPGSSTRDVAGAAGDIEHIAMPGAGASQATIAAFHERCSPTLIRSFIRSYLRRRRGSNTPRTSGAFSSAARRGSRSWRSLRHRLAGPTWRDHSAARKTALACPIPCPNFPKSKPSAAASPAHRGQADRRAEVRRARPAPAVSGRFQPSARGTRVSSRSTRRGKYILLELDDGRVADHASRHVRADADRAARHGDSNVAALHDHVVFDTRRRHADPLQRPAPLRIDGARPTQATLDSHPLFSSSGPEPLSESVQRGRYLQPRSRASARRSRPRCSTSTSSPGSATSMSARRCTAPAFRRARLATNVGRARRKAGRARSARC